MNPHNQKRRQQLYELLGDLPDRHRSVSGQVLTRETHDLYVCERLVLDLNGVEPVPAVFVRPADGADPFPTVLYNHAHGNDYDLGKDELRLGRDLLSEPPYAEELARMGCCSLCIDAWGFGQRQGRTETEIFRQMLWSGQVLWGMMVYDSLKAVDYLVSRPDVDADRLATLGLSMGSTMAWWVAALDTRIKVCIDLCCLTDFQALIETRGLSCHGAYYFVPGLLKHFTTSQINALIAPRPHLSLAGDRDPLTPPAGLDRIDAEMRRVYATEGIPDAWRLIRYDHGHLETPAMRREVVCFLTERLLETDEPPKSRGDADQVARA